VYDAPLDPLSVLGWSLAGLALLLAALRAVRVEYRAAVAVGGPRPAGPADRVLDGALGLALAALLGVLVTVVVAGLG
jgi:hypothetical protein